MSLQALIFDVGGTLADTERDGHRPAFNLAFEQAGLDWYWDRQTYGELLSESRPDGRIRLYLQRFRPAVLASSECGVLITDLVRRKTAIYMGMVENGRVPLRPGVPRLLQQARALGLQLAIATSTGTDEVTALLEHGLGTGSSGWFGCIATGELVSARKPAPDVYRYALQQLSLDAKHCLALENSSSGLRAATAAGIPTVVTVSDYTRDQSFEGALAVLSDFGEPGRPAAARWPLSAPQQVGVDTLRDWHGLRGLRESAGGA